MASIMTTPIIIIKSASHHQTKRVNKSTESKTKATPHSARTKSKNMKGGHHHRGNTSPSSTSSSSSSTLASLLASLPKDADGQIQPMSADTAAKLVDVREQRIFGIWRCNSATCGHLWQSSHTYVKRSDDVYYASSQQECRVCKTPSWPCALSEFKCSGCNNGVSSCECVCEACGDIQRECTCGHIHTRSSTPSAEELAAQIKAHRQDLCHRCCGQRLSCPQRRYNNIMRRSRV